MTPMHAGKGTSDQVRAVAYVRQSKKREDDSRTSPDAQRAKCEALITAKGWHNAGTFADIGVSGWDPDIVRPEFEEMMTAARNGEIDAVVIFMLSRLTRRGALEAMRIQEELASYGVLLVSVEEPYLDTSTPMGVAVFGLIAALAQQESDNKSTYIKATKETLRAAGSHVGGMSPYGFRSTKAQRNGLTVVRLVPDENEAPHVRQMVAWALEGITPGAIAGRLNEANVPTRTTAMGPKGDARLKARQAAGHSAPLPRTAWYSTNVGRLLRDPRLAGYALAGQGRAAEILYVDGEPLKAHEGIIPTDDWWRLKDVLDGRTVLPRKGKGKTASATLLAGYGLLHCGVCGANMAPDTRADKTYYRCVRPKGAVEGHGGLAIRSDVTDDMVAGRVWSRLTALDIEDPEDQALLVAVSARFALQNESGERDAERAAAVAELEHVQAALRTLHLDRQNGLYGGSTGSAMYAESVTRLTALEARTEAHVAALVKPADDVISIPAEWVEPGTDPLGPDSLWAAWDLTERREFLRLFLADVRIDASNGRGRHAKTAERIQLDWIDQP
jgi:site-specific DNA recombinase